MLHLWVLKLCPGSKVVAPSSRPSRPARHDTPFPALAPAARRVTLLHEAGQHGHAHVVKWLLSQRVDPNIRTLGNDATALELAIMEGCHNAAEVLRCDRAAGTCRGCARAARGVGPGQAGTWALIAFVEDAQGSAV